MQQGCASRSFLVPQNGVPTSKSLGFWPELLPEGRAPCLVCMFCFGRVFSLLQSTLGGRKSGLYESRCFRGERRRRWEDARSGGGQASGILPISFTSTPAVCPGTLHFGMSRSEPPNQAKQDLKYSISLSAQTSKNVLAVERKKQQLLRYRLIHRLSNDL